MKYRLSFVSNSSSASFVIYNVKKLTKDQLDAVYHHITYALKHKMPCGKVNGFGYSEHDQWSLTHHDDALHGWTSMDNFHFDKFLELLEVTPENYTFDGEGEY